MKTKPISDDTRAAILDATWTLIAKRKRLDLSHTEIAAAAGVSRQTIYLAFGGRAGLLTAMLRNKDTQSDHVARLIQIGQSENPGVKDLERYLEVWMDYLPLVYPVAILLDAAAVTDEEAAAAWDDRMKSALLMGFERILKKLAKAELVVGKPAHLAQLAWSLVHPTAWRLLVVECGWTPQEFRRSRLELVRSLITAR